VNSSAGFWRRWWWIPVLSILVVVAAGGAFFFVLPKAGYSTAGKACSDFDVRPLQELFGTKPAMVVEEETAATKVSCLYRVLGADDPVSLPGVGELQPGVAILAITAWTFETPQQAKEQFDDSGPPEDRQEVSGIGERATLLIMPVSSDAPDAMTDYDLLVLDDRLLLMVRLQAMNFPARVDEAKIKPAVIKVARLAMSALA
jgi:hypothetical protein